MCIRDSVRGADLLEVSTLAQAEGWVIKGKLVRSQKFNALNGDDFTQKVYCLLIACKDSWGMMPADSASLKGTLGPLDETKKAPVYEKAVKKLWGAGLVFLWDHQGAPWLYVLGHDEENQVSRRAANPQVPRPDIDYMWAETNKLLSESGLTQDKVLHPPARARSRSQSPFPNPNPDPNPGFEEFWKAYPRRDKKKDARRAWGKLNPSPELQQTILADIDRRRRSTQWTKDGGQFVPLPTTYLNGERWNDGYEVEVVDDGIPQGSDKNMAVLRRALERAKNEQGNV